MQTAMKRSAQGAGSLALLACLLAFAGHASAATAYITNEKGDSISVIDLDKLEVLRTVKVGQRPRGIALSRDDSLMFVCLGDDDTIAVLDTKSLKEVGELASGPDPEQLRVSPDGKLVFVANENDALLTAIDIATRKALTEVPVGVEPEGVAVSPDGSIVVNTSETTSMAHFIDWRSKKLVASVLVDPRPRYAEFNRDGSELWVSSEVGGTIRRSASSRKRSLSTSRGCRRSRFNPSEFASAPTESSLSSRWVLPIGSPSSTRLPRRC